MAVAKFYKYKDAWRYKVMGEDAKPVDTYALENFLGVFGGPRVVVLRETEKLPMAKLRVEVCEGFIAHASVAVDDLVPLHEGQSVEEFFVRQIIK